MKNLFSCLALAATLGCLLISIQPMLAQGTAFTYQGQLSVSGGPANGNYDFTFALTNSTGQQVGVTLTNLDVGVTNGLFIVTLEFGSVFTGSNYWLTIGVRTNGGASFIPLSPSQELTPTPYAIYAPNAGEAASANSVAGTNIVGVIPLGHLPPGVLTNGESGVDLSGAFTGNVTATTLQIAPLSVVSSTNYATNGTYTFTVPPSVTAMVVKLWGAGGGGGDATSGGGGAFSQVSFNVTPGDTYVVVVGQGGGAFTAGGGGGGAGSNDGSGGAGYILTAGLYSGAGGQASSLFHYTNMAYIMQAVAGGGGGGSDYGGAGAGQAGGSGIGYAATATTTGVTNLNLLGGDGQTPPNQGSGGGGGGYGGGSAFGSGAVAFGGGSYGDVTFGGSDNLPGNTTDTNYLSGSAVGGTNGNLGPSATSGSDGLAVVLFGTGGGFGLNTLSVAGEVGIGTTTPQQKLDVNGNINASGAVTAASISGNGGGLSNLNAANLTGALSAISGANLTALPSNAALLNANQTFTGQNSFSAVANLNGGISMNSANGYDQSAAGPFYVDAPGIIGGRFTVTTSGNLGIGMNNPAKQLELSGNVGAVSAGASIDPSVLVRLDNTATDGTTSSPNFAGIGFGKNSTRQAIVGGTFGNDYLDFYTGGLLTTPKMRIDYNGNVGIGITKPASPLQVAGNIQMGSGGADYAASGPENLRIVRGIVNPSGSVFAGSGFTAAHNGPVGTGSYTITFSPAFSGDPTVTASGVNTIVRVGGTISSSSITVQTSNLNGSSADDTFSFIAIGPQ